MTDKDEQRQKIIDFVDEATEVYKQSENPEDFRVTLAARFGVDVRVDK